MSRWKKAAAVVLAAGMVLGSIPAAAYAASTSTATENGTFTNPLIYSDVPDLDIIRVGDNYYMVSTTMHLSPGCPVMKSTDLVNWEIVNYVYDTLGDGDEMTLRNGKSMYGNGQWASSLQYHGGKYYVAFNSNTLGRVCIFTTDDIENGSWTRTELEKPYHDMALFFDDDAAYIVYGGNEIRYVELNENLTGEKEGGRSGLLFTSSQLTDLGYSYDGPPLFEGTHVMKKDGYYYVFNISWPSGKPRLESCSRSRTFPEGNWETRVILEANYENNGVASGVAQGGVIDTKDGRWYGFLFQDHGPIGRVPVLTDCTWKDGWPMLGKDGDGRTVEAQMALPVSGSDVRSIVKSDEFYNDAEHRVFETAGKGQDVAAASYDAGMDEAALDGTVYAAGADAQASRTVELITNGGAETGNANGWTTTPGEYAGTVAGAVDTEKASGKYSLYVHGRTSTGAGACQDISGSLAFGKTYTISGKLKYTAGPDEKQFFVTIQNGADYRWRENIVSISAKKGEWVSFEGTYTVHDKSGEFPFDATKNYIFIENPWTAEPVAENDYMDYYLDDFSMTTESDNIITNGSFENGLDGWEGFAGGTLEAVKNAADALDGSSYVKAINRANTSQGPFQDLFGKLEGGSVYTVSAWVKYDAGPDEKQFNISIQTGGGAFTNIAVATIPKGVWTKIQGEYEFPADAEMANLYFETPWKAEPDQAEDLMDFCVDNVSAEKKAAAQKDTAKPGESDYNGSNLDLAWQWNHNPDNNNWSLTDRSGWLRLRTGSKSTSILNARNTLTQRTFGPQCSGVVKMDVSHMKNGDYAGLSAFNNQYGFVGVKMANGSKSVVMVKNNGKSGEPAAEDRKEIESKPLDGDIVYCKADFDFANGDKANFYYSMDGKTWTKIGDELSMAYDLVHFMGYRFGLFNYATASIGGYVDFDYFRVSDEVTGTAEQSAVAAQLADVGTVPGVVGAEFDVPLSMDALPSGKYTKISASFSIPECMDVSDVAFNKENLTGDASYSYKNHRLSLSVAGTGVGFKNKGEDKLFATIHLKLNQYAAEDMNAELLTDYIRISGKNDAGLAVAADTAGVKSVIGIKSLPMNAVAKKLGYSNPIADNQFSSDPYAITYDGRVYVYMTNDTQEYDTCIGEDGLPTHSNTFASINTLSVVSSADMVNWTDHGDIPVAGKNNLEGIAKWADCSWAPAACHKTIDGKEKFFLYFANGAGGIGVLEADSPVGPFREPETGSCLIEPGSAATEGVVWLFDPAVLVDDDGTGYLFYGGGIPDDKDMESCNHPGTERVIKLAGNMVQTEGEAVNIGAPAMFEDSGIHKYKGKYYYTYCSNFSNNLTETGNGNICAMVSDSPMGPYTYSGYFLDNPYAYFGVGGNNHHAIFEFEGQQYITYHAQTLGKALGVTDKTVVNDKGEAVDVGGYRSTHIDKISYYSDGSIKRVDASMKGVAQLKGMNPYERVEGETFAWQSGTKVSDCSEAGGMAESENTQLTDIQNGDWTALSQVEFGGKGTEKFTARIASKNGAKISIYLDDPTSDPYAKLDVKATPDGTYEDMEWDVAGITGTHNLFFVFQGDAQAENLMDLDCWQFTEKTSSGSEEGAGRESVAKLTATVNSVKNYKKANYTEKTWKTFSAALKNAQNVLAKKNPAQKEVDKAQKDLDAAKNALRKPAINVKGKITVGVKEKVALKVTGATVKKYSSSRPKIVSVSKKGQLTAKKKGTSIIKVKLDTGKTFTVKVTAKAAPEKISLNKKITLKKGKTFQIKVKFPKKAACYKLSYQSDKKSVAKADANGKVKALKKGKATITVTTFNKKKAKLQVTVK